jgi:hypothetical protein
MKDVSSLVLFLLPMLVSAPLSQGQDLSKYRNFAYGMSLVEVSGHFDSQPIQAKLIHKRPVAIQELTWWPKDSSGNSLQTDSVRQIFFSFYNGELYRILVTYDRHATQGLTAEDLIQAVSTHFGTATRPAVEISFSTNELYRATEKVIARWEDSQYSINLVRCKLLNSFALVMFSKQLDAQAEAAIAESAKLDEQNIPQREADRRKKAADDLEVTRQSNKRTFRP